MIPTITLHNVTRVYECLSTFRDTAHGKMEATRPLLNRLQEEELWLLSFVHFCVSGNRFLKVLDDSPYYVIPPATTQTSTFEDFLEVLRTYKRARITPKNEKILILFLRGCTADHRDFYISLMTKPSWLRQLFHLRYASDYTDMSTINSEDIYGGKKKLLQTSFSCLTYPVVVTTIPRRDLPSAIIYRNGNSTSVKKFSDGRSTKLPNWLTTDSKFIQDLTYVLLGFLDEEAERFYPVDYFHNIQDYRSYLHGCAAEPLYRRIRQLDDFLQRNFLRQIQKLRKEYVIAASTIERAVRAALVGSTHNLLLFLNEGGASHVMPAREVKGIIGGIWEEEGIAKGFIVWHNTYPVHCSYDFSGVNNALLFSPKLVVGKVVKIWLFVFEGFRSGTVKEILFDEKAFCPEEIELLNGDYGRVEKCVYCARDRTEVRHLYHGYCINTANNWQSLFGRWGPDVWILPTPRLVKNRRATAWEPFMLNNTGFHYKGYLLVCRESDGALMFKTDPPAMEKYLAEIKDNTGRWTDVVRYTTAEDLHERYLKRYKVTNMRTRPSKEPEDGEFIMDGNRPE